MSVQALCHGQQDAHHHTALYLRLWIIHRANNALRLSRSIVVNDMFNGALIASQLLESWWS